MISKPKIFKEAVEFILEKDFLPTDEWDSETWLGEEENIALRAFWSAKVEIGRFLDRAQAFLFDELTNATEKVVGPDGVERIALRAGGRANFVRHMREFMISEGMVEDEDEYKEANQNDVRDIRSESRLRLIYDTNIRQAYGYGQWKQGMTPAVLRRYPAQRLVRDREVSVERARHTESEGEVRLKQDTAYWADYQNDPEIGGFAVPWAPFGFHSGMGLRDVSREESDELGISAPLGKPVRKWEMNDNLQSSVKKMSPEVKQKLIDELRSYKAIDAGKAGREAAIRLREENGILSLENDKIQASYDPNQKRAGKGQPNGGQWVSEMRKINNMDVEKYNSSPFYWRGTNRIDEFDDIKNGIQIISIPIVCLARMARI